MRECGGCTACCKIMAIDELKKPPSVWCPHCEIAKGCQIYADRPQDCRNFRCLWLDDERLPDAMRPDKTKVVLFKDLKNGQLRVNCDPDRPTAWKEGLTGAYIEMVRKLGVKVMLVVGKKSKLRAIYNKAEAV